jgi:hypothetical protein
MPLKLVSGVASQLSGVPSKLTFAPPSSLPRATSLHACPSSSSPECQVSFLFPFPHPSLGQSVFRPLKIVLGVPRKVSVAPPPHPSPGQPVLRPLKFISGVPSKLSFPPPSSLPQAIGLQGPQDRLMSANKAFFPPSLIPPPGNRFSGPSRSSKKAFFSPPSSLPRAISLHALQARLWSAKQAFFPPSSLPRATGLQAPPVRLWSAK